MLNLSLRATATSHGTSTIFTLKNECEFNTTQDLCNSHFISIDININRIYNRFNIMDFKSISCWYVCACVRACVRACVCVYFIYIYIYIYIYRINTRLHSLEYKYIF